MSIKRLILFKVCCNCYRDCFEGISEVWWRVEVEHIKDGMGINYLVVLKLLRGFWAQCFSLGVFLTCLSLAALRGEVRAARRDRLHPQRGCACVRERDGGGGGDQEPQTEDPADAAPRPAPHHPEWLQSLRVCPGGGGDNALLELSCSSWYQHQEPGQSLCCCLCCCSRSQQIWLVVVSHVQDFGCQCSEKHFNFRD